MNSETKEDLIMHTIVLDTGSSASIFANPDFLVRIGRLLKALKLFTNGGGIKSNMIGLHEELKMWFNPESISKLLSLSRVATKYRVVMDSSKDEAIFVHLETTGWVKFCLDSLGLCVHDVRDGVSDFFLKSINNNLQNYSLLQIVNTNTSQFSEVEAKQATGAKILAT